LDLNPRWEFGISSRIFIEFFGHDESTYRHWLATVRPVAIFGFLARDNARQAIVRAERLNAELIKDVDRLFAPFPLDEENKAQRTRAVRRDRNAHFPGQCASGGLQNLPS
jgi:hypothetical protein